MKRIGLVLFGLWASVFAGRAFGFDAKILAGNYELTGVMETAGMLMLNGDGSYVAGFSYGAADWMEIGTWKLEGEEVVLSDGRFKIKNYPKLPLFLPSGTRFRYQDGKLTSLAPERKLVFLNPNKTPAAVEPAAGECVPLQDPSVKLVDGSLLAVDRERVVINDVAMHRDVTVRRAWAEKNIPGLLQPPRLYQLVQKEIPKSAVLCVRPVTAGEGRMRVRGKVVKLDREALVVQMGDCLSFAVGGLSPSVLKQAKEPRDGAIDVEIPYSAILSGGSCP